MLSWSQALLLDTDGSFSGHQGGASIIGEYAPLAFPAPQCFPAPAWGGYVCPRIVFRNAVLINRTVGRRAFEQALCPC